MALVSVIGLSGSLDDLRRLEKRKLEGVKSALLRGAFQLQARVQRYCPVDTGRLRNSIEVSWSWRPPGGVVGQISASTTAGNLDVIVGTATEYAPYVCFGTWKMGARPFLRPAFYEFKDRILLDVQRAVTNTN